MGGVWDDDVTAPTTSMRYLSLNDGEYNLIAPS